MLTENVLDLIGNTPLIRLRGEAIYAKAEFLNPGGSIKDRVALAMLEGAERDGKLRPDSIIVEPTSGNTGIGVALIGRLKGYSVRIVMPEGMSDERKKFIRALGGDLVLTPDAESIPGAVRKVQEIAASDPRVFVPQQFENPDNPRCHYEETARELWRQMVGRHCRLRRWRRERRHAARSRQIPQGTSTGCADRGGRAQERLGLAGARTGPASDPGHRRRLHPADSRRLPGRRSH